jgi:hypothetical protein
MKMNPFTYLKATVRGVAVIELDSFIVFCKYAEQHHIKEIFLLENDSKFGLLHQQIMFETSTCGFKTIEDALTSSNNKFPSAEIFYTAIAEGITNYDWYILKNKYGIQDLEILKKLQDEGFIEGFEMYQQESFSKPKVLPVFENAYEFFSYAKENDFESVQEFTESLSKGFIIPLPYRIAKRLGYEDYDSYIEGSENNFPDNETYQRAKESNIKTYDEFLSKYNLELSYPELTHDQNLFLLLLSKLEQGKKVSLNKLKTLFESQLEEYKDPNGKLFHWFTVALQTDKDYADFLQNNKHVTQFITYDVDGEFLEVFQLKNRSVVIDGSNVAHNSQNGKTDRPSIANLLRMVRFLKTKGFTDILIIADASLRHKLVDLNKLSQLNQEAKYTIAPAGVAADIYLIQHVKRKHCLLISNDTFKQYKQNDPWVAVNIDFYRLTFMIDENEVMMPDIE